MHPVLFRLPGLGFPIRSFGVTVACGILFAIWLWGRILERRGDDPANDPARSSQVALWIVIGVLLGARLFYVGVEVTRYLTADLDASMQAYLSAPDRVAASARLAKEAPDALEAASRVVVGHDFLHDPFKVLLIWQGGLVMYGGLIGGILLGLWGARKYGLEPWRALDTGLLSGFFGLAIGRWGCLMVGDDYGSRVPTGWADSWMPIGFGNGGRLGPLTVRVPDAEWLVRNPESLFNHDLAGQVLWASQPWMSLGAILCGLMGWFWLRRCPQRGLATALMLVQYALTRFTIEFFRGDEVRGVWFDGRLSTSQLVSIVLLVLGLYLVVQRRRAPVPAT